MSLPPRPFVPALLVVDVQNDFTTGSLAVPDGPAVIQPINQLLSLPFPLKIATQDWHPRDHVSFAANHEPPNNTPFTSSTTIVHPTEPTRIYNTTLWPVHCVADTPGADFDPRLDRPFDHIVRKGRDRRVEMYSAFTDPFHPTTPAGLYEQGSTSVCTSELEPLLRERGVTHLYVVGLATEYCVLATAADGRRFGFDVVVVEEGTRAVGGEEVRRECFTERLPKVGVRVVGLESEEVKWVEELGRAA